MRLAACINAWGDTLNLLPYCIENLIPVVDEVIVIWSERSNYGEKDEQMTFIAENYRNKKTSFIQLEPDKSKTPAYNETAKRNYGLQMAIAAKCTHFISMDADELYEQEAFLKEKERFLNENLNGLVCGSQVYFASPNLTIGMDTTRVTFIHKITPGLKFEFNRSYPYAWDGNALRIDPTRSLNINNGIEFSDIIMHHYSYIREDIDKKIRNSTAKGNIERSTLRQDFLSAKEGQMCNFYSKKLFRATVDFGIPDVHKILQPLEASPPQIFIG